MAERGFDFGSLTQHLSSFLYVLQDSTTQRNTVATEIIALWSEVIT